jgi:indolepyruvate ferredoxin oxidoreductase alpha subunit
MPGMANAAYNKSKQLIIVLDNRITAMTGHQPNPGVGITGMGEVTNPIPIEDVARSFGIKNVKVVDPFNVKEMIKTVKEFLKKDELSVIVAKRECQLLAVRKKKRKGIKIVKFDIDQEKCTRCGICLNEFACPAIHKERGRFYINKNICTGCAVCTQICPAKAIKAVVE